MRWRGWYALGSILMMIVGAFKFITGIIGLFRDEWIVLGYNGYMLVDITGLAVWWLIMGALLVLGGMAGLESVGCLPRSGQHPARGASGGNA